MNEPNRGRMLGRGLIVPLVIFAVVFLMNMRDGMGSLLVLPLLVFVAILVVRVFLRARRAASGPVGTGTAPPTQAMQQADPQQFVVPPVDGPLPPYARPGSQASGQLPPTPLTPPPAPNVPTAEPLRDGLSPRKPKRDWLGR